MPTLEEQTNTTELQMEEPNTSLSLSLATGGQQEQASSSPPKRDTNSERPPQLRQVILFLCFFQLEKNTIHMAKHPGHIFLPLALSVLQLLLIQYFN
jgi:hypothetical protein